MHTVALKVKPVYVKQVLAETLNFVQVNDVLQLAQTKLLSPFIRAVYYHDIPPSEADLFEQQLRFFSGHFTGVGYDELLQFHNNRWYSARPGLILSFDDGYRSFYEVVAPLLEKYGFVGWFFISPALLDIKSEEQAHGAIAHRVWPKPFDYGSPRVFMTWEQARELTQKHVIGCHTLSHCRLGADVSGKQMYQEIIESKQLLQERLQRQIDAFAWVGGEETSYSSAAAKFIRNGNYRVAFLTNNAVIRPHTDLHLLNRTHIDSSFSFALMRFQLSGLLDIVYAPKRRRVTKCITRDQCSAGRAII
jgi:peptidoglycan/xylan/chitin deacetylase (PgdA/CDA1 family)